MSFDIAICKSIGDRSLNIRIDTSDRLIALVGPSGAGKTTLLNCIAGLARPDSGHIAIGGTLMFGSAENVNMPPEGRGCGYVFQDVRLFPHRSVRHNLLYGQPRASADPALAIDDVVAMLAIGHLLDRMPANLSGGEARRVAIGRALLSGPRFLLLDEPLSSLDPERAEPILRAIEHLRDQLAIPIIYVSHDTSEVERLTQSVIRIG